MDKCISISCGCNLSVYKDEVGEDKLYYCPECGQMLIQKCPHGCSREFVYDEKKDAEMLCPNQECGKKIVFCKMCGKIHEGGISVICECGNIIKTNENVFLGGGASYGRTNVYEAEGDINYANNERIKNIEIGTDFSKSVLRNGEIYFWKKDAAGGISLIRYSIFKDNGELYDEKNINFDEKETGVSALYRYGENISVGHIEEVEIFGDYIVTNAKNNILINSISSGSLIANIELNRITGNNMPVIRYKAAVLNKILIVVLITQAGEEVVWLDIAGIANNNYLPVIKRSCLYTVTAGKYAYAIVTADPAVLSESNCAYFAGNSKNVYKLTADKETKKLNTPKAIPVEIPENLINSEFYFNQIATLSESEVYLTGYADDNTYLFELEEEKFVLKNSIENCEAAAGKISFLKNNDIYIAGKNSTGSNCFGKYNKETLENFNAQDKKLSGDDILNYYITLHANNTSLIYLKRSGPDIKIIGTIISPNGIVSEKLTIDRIFAKTDFYVYKNNIVVCTHSGAAGKIFVTRCH